MGELPGITKYFCYVVTEDGLHRKGKARKVTHG